MALDHGLRVLLDRLREREIAETEDVVLDCVAGCTAEWGRGANL